jgi:hypothetical protein
MFWIAQFSAYHVGKHSCLEKSSYFNEQVTNRCQQRFHLDRMTCRYIIGIPITTLKDTQRRFSGPIRDNHNHFVTSCTIEKDVFAFGIRCR